MAAQTLRFSLPFSPRSRNSPSKSHYPAIISANQSISGRNLRAAVIGGGPAGSSAAEALASGGVETFLFERSPNTAKPCGGAIPLCMLDEFQIPPHLIDRHVTRLKIFSPSNIAVDFNKTLCLKEFITMHVTP